MSHSDLCKANILLGLEVHDFLINVPGVKEESVTDFLIWRWAQLDTRFNYVSATTFTRHQEHTLTGADFELELWLVGRKRSIPLLFQAKKFVKPHDSYVRRFNYPGNTQRQLAALQKYAATRSLLPFYAIYSPNDLSAKSMCQGRSDASSSGIFMLSASKAKAFGDGKYGKRLGLQTILEKSNPFHCLFCCPIARGELFFKGYFGLDSAGLERRSDELPQYVRKILDSKEASELELWPEECASIKAIGVYDLREEE